MKKSDAAFTSSIAANYEEYLLPLLFTPYANDLAGRLRVPTGATLLEIAAGTGALTRIIAEQLPADVAILATDINDGMLDIATQVTRKKNVQFRQADAMQLPFADASFDAIVCQFGVMFFPDKVTAYKEALRVLKPGGTFLLNAWDRLENNLVAFEICQAVRQAAALAAPTFLERGPYAYFDPLEIHAHLKSAGFPDVQHETVQKNGHAASPRHAVLGFCEGSPLQTDLYERGEAVASRCVQEAIAALEKRFGIGPFDAEMSAHVFVATKA